MQVEVVQEVIRAANGMLLEHMGHGTDRYTVSKVSITRGVRLIPKVKPLGKALLYDNFIQLLIR